MVNALASPNLQSLSDLGKVLTIQKVKLRAVGSKLRNRTYKSGLIPQTRFANGPASVNEQTV
jgi:hypothetical protein